MPAKPVLKRSVSLHRDDELIMELYNRRILLLEDDVNESMSSQLKRELLTLTVGFNKAPVWIMLNSPGGGVYQGLSVYDTIKGVVSRGQEVNILADGYVASMGAVILQAATRRYSLPSTQFLVHQISEAVLFRVQEVNESEEQVVELKRLNRVVMGIIAGRSGMPLDELLELSRKKDCWYSPEQAKNFGANGLIDEVIEALPF